MGRKRYFSVEEANALVPTLERRFGVILQIRAQLRRLYAELERLGAAPGEPPPPQRRDDSAVLAEGHFRGLRTALQQEIRALEADGVTIKDLDAGTCEIPSLSGGREVLLCWQLGEKQIATWHEPGQSAACRQPLADAPPARLH